LRAKNKEGKPSKSTQPKKSDTPPKTMVAPNKENREQNNHPIVKAHVQERKEILKSQSYFNFENEIHKIKTLVPLLEFMKNKDFKKSISKMLHPEYFSHSTDSVNL
jgi:hypothetical protein